MAVTSSRNFRCPIARLHRVSSHARVLARSLHFGARIASDSHHDSIVIRHLVVLDSFFLHTTCPQIALFASRAVSSPRQLLASTLRHVPARPKVQDESQGTTPRVAGRGGGGRCSGTPTCDLCHLSCMSRSAASKGTHIIHIYIYVYIYVRKKPLAVSCDLAAYRDTPARRGAGPGTRARGPRPASQDAVAVAEAGTRLHVGVQDESQGQGNTPRVAGRGGGGRSCGTHTCNLCHQNLTCTGSQRG
jgi:hypothetical protein